MSARIRVRLLPLVLLVLPLTTGCATGGATNPEDWFWTIMTAVVTFIVGFLVAAMMSKEGGIRISTHRHRHHRRTQAGWDRMAKHVGDGTTQGLADWRGAGHGADGDWDDLTRRIQERIFEEMRKYHD